MKILTILGARPQFIKAGSVSREVVQHKDIQEVIVHTGQHYDANMSDIFFEEMQIPKPHYFLGIGGKSHGAMTGQMIEKIEEVALKEAPDWMLVYGDTNSTLAGAIVASKLHIKLAHVEAGLRSFNRRMPEEINRILTDRVSQVLFCPTETAMHNLEQEGYKHLDCKIVKSGDVMQDGAVFYKQYANKPNNIPANFILCTIHRAENTDDLARLKAIFAALDKIASQQPVVLPLHPRTKKIMDQHQLQISNNINIIEPVGYLEMVWLIYHCKMVMTDSGGLQKEAFFFAKPCITLRDETEWVELITHKFNVLAGADTQKILDVYQQASSYFNFNFDKDLYGGGKASQTIVNTLLQY